jgi:hypothetical protein
MADLNWLISAKSLSDRNESIEEGLPARCANERLRNADPHRAEFQHFVLQKAVVFASPLATGFRNGPLAYDF